MSSLEHLLKIIEIQDHRRMSLDDAEYLFRGITGDCTCTNCPADMSLEQYQKIDQKLLSVQTNLKQVQQQKKAISILYTSEKN